MQNVTHGHWRMMHELTCTLAAFQAWLEANPSVGVVVGQAESPGKFRVWTILPALIDVHGVLSTVAHSTNASLHITSWYLHTDAPYAGMQVSCGGDYTVADHITEQSPEYFTEIQKKCCMHCCVELGLATQEEYDFAQSLNAQALEASGLSDQETEVPSEFSKLNITKAEVLLCTLLDMKLRIQLDDPITPQSELTATAVEIKELVQRLMDKAPQHMTSLEKFKIVKLLFPNAKIAFGRIQPDGTIKEVSPDAPVDQPAPVVPETPPADEADDGSVSFSA